MYRREQWSAVLSVRTVLTAIPPLKWNCTLNPTAWLFYGYMSIWRFCARCRGRLPPRGVLGVLPGGSSDALDRLPASKNRVRRVRMVQSRGAKMRYRGHQGSGRSWSSRVLISKQEAQGGAWGHYCENGVLFRAPRRSRSAMFYRCQLGLRRSRHARRWAPLV